ncbi:hypothetical protein [Streptomyces sp. cg35]|uniref:hypothetical protein n=1 Tax=Streptomyces sp. cg35 TaxID=3421650 RepID=UPI003D186BF7
MALPVVVAHQSGDGVTIAHCPFCGSGQVIGRSDGNAECTFCNQAFLVRVQPMFSAFPQSVNGMPVDIPGMPQAPAPGMLPGGDPMAAGATPDDGAGAPPFGDDGGDEAGGEEPPGGSDAGDSGPPFGKKESMFRTASGRHLPRGAYVDYLADQLGVKR